MPKKHETKIWREKYRIPQYLVQGFGDQGLVEYVHGPDDVEKDDLRVTIELSAGHKILLCGNCRLVFYTDELVVEYLVNG